MGVVYPDSKPILTFEEKNQTVVVNQEGFEERRMGFCNNFHNILRLSDVLPNFPFTTSETMGDYNL